MSEDTIRDWTVERLGRRGDGVAFDAAGQRALAARVLPGEVIAGAPVEGRIADPKIVTPSPERIRSACPHYRACGGCALMHASDGFVAGWKAGLVTSALAAQGIVAEVSGISTSPIRSRRRAVLSGKRTKKGALVGFHARASDVIVDLQDCLVLRPAIQAALPFLRELVTAGGSRQAELSIAVTETPQGLDLAVKGGKPMEPGLFAALSALSESGDLARLDWDGEPITRRPPALTMGRAQVVPPPGGFLQATREGEAALVTAVRDILKDAGRIADLFAGCGTFTLPLAEQAEVDAFEGLAAPLAALDSAWRKTATLKRVASHVRDLAKRPLQPDELAPYDAIVIDPPRAGAEPQAVELARSGVQRLAWVSCDPVTFARDARILAEGGYQLRRLYVVDQFRWSAHVETVAEFARR
ncbi:class I SAM-dependent RNA methyltransferase [Paracoccus aminophilus]|uniref:23S rRNA (Uracil-5-)-methyltransferase RumA n=1 Tax=Paracoccus aminophilus JCM 7686 TaxID=1367847 RepID=S5XXK0_PARAH|nr:class I SAM-dependent RNA methyltransferase [Paracoccus aminophilus]AGT10017.1 23S rRNA (Uracil-5-)-methyltransferase RumA [Paracoccus aminophilus JCM 7686]